MSSKRGRKRNDNLPPNRARDVQRAFRARRAAHLEALQDRVTMLEEENTRLRDMLGLPPSERPLLGRGPTGKDKPIPNSSRAYVSQSGLVLDPSIRQVTPSTEPSSATTTSSSSPGHSWRQLNNTYGTSQVIQGLQEMHWADQNIQVVNDDTLDPSRSPSVVSQTKPPSSYPVPLPSHNSPSSMGRPLSNTSSFFQSQPYHSDRSTSGTDPYSPVTPGSSPFMMRDAPDSNKHNDQYPPQYPQSYSGDGFASVHHHGHHHSLSCELPMSTTHSLPNFSQPPSRDTHGFVGHKRSITSPDVSALAVNGAFPHHSLNSQTRNSSVRSPLPLQIPPPLMSGISLTTDVACRTGTFGA